MALLVQNTKKNSGLGFLKGPLEKGCWNHGLKGKNDFDYSIVRRSFC